MKITKTTLLFIATLFFLTLPLMFVGGNAQAAVFNGDGAVHNGTTGLYEVPADAATCTGATEADAVDSAAHDIPLSSMASGEKCSTVEPAWVRADFTDQTTCETKGYHWGGSCSGNSSGHPHTQVDCENLGGTWTPFCANFYTENAAYAAGRTAHECLLCHNGGHASNRAGYLKGGHKNMSRKADGMPWAGSIENGSAIYPGYDWTTPAAGYTNANGPVPGSDSSVSGKALYWIYDGWIGASPRAISDAGLGVCSNSTYKNQTDCVNGGATWNANQPVSSYSCGRCHTTGWTADATIDTLKEPEASFPGINNIVNLSAADDNGVKQTSSSWDHFGILCSRCHNAVDGGHANSGPAADNMEFGDPAGYASQNAKCYNCHRQVDGNNLPLDAATRKIGEELWIANSHGALGIKSHANGFLNSPHARFSGTYGQLEDTTLYDSHFFDNDGACAGCHNLHDSVTDTAVGGQPWNNECGLDCHGQSGTYGKPLANINHPTGPGTPLYNVTTANPVEACQTCHMPGGIHLFRINADPTYTTFPAANMNVPTIPNADGFPEAYVDLDMACGQCHGGGDASTEAAAKAVAAEHGAPYITKADLAPLAEVMHGGAGSSAPTGKLFMWTNDSSNAFAVNFTVTGAACTEGGCSYTWDFGDGGTGHGPAISHTYANGTPVTATLTVSNGGTNAQIVTPIDVHQAPTCTDDTTFSAAVNAGVSGMAVSFTDGTTPTSDGTPGVYVNWGDGSPLSVGGTGATFTHTYIWPNSAVGYKVTAIVQDNLGFNCVNKAYVKIGSGGASATTGDVTINVTPGVNTSYYFKQGGLTKVSGSFTGAEVTAGSAAVTVPTGTYDLYLYFASGHTCDYTQGQSATTGDTVTVSCTTP